MTFRTKFLIAAYSSLLATGTGFTGYVYAKMESKDSYQSAFNAGRTFENAKYGKDFLTEIEERVSADRGESVKKPRTLNELMASLDK